MVKNKIEDLFKNKLEGYVLEPSNEAMDRFQGMIQHKRRKGLIRRIGIADSILLLAFAGIYSIRTLNTEKIDLANGEAFDAGTGTEMAIVNEMPDPGPIPAGIDGETVPESEMAYSLKSSSAESSLNENPSSDAAEEHSLIAQGNKSLNLKSEKDNQSDDLNITN